jgi:xylitol oxidase
MMRTNWSRNQVFGATDVQRPHTISALQRTIAHATGIKVLGSGHSFNRIADTHATHLILDAMPTAVEFDTHRHTARVSAQMRYGAFAEQIAAAGYAVPNMASLPHISVAGAVATGTHGSGMRVGNLATAVVAMTVVLANGDIQEWSADRNGETFAGMVVHLGGLAVVTHLTFALVPTFDVRQDVYLDVPFDTAMDHFSEIMGSSYSVSLFTRWTEGTIDQIWRKSIASEVDALPAPFFGSTPATRPYHPIATLDAAPCTDQLGVFGPWHMRLPHFKMEFTPSSGDELQTEYYVGHQDAVSALNALATIRHEIEPLLHVSEIRTIARDDLWLSGQYQRDSVAIHFTWKNQWADVQRLLPAIESLLAPFGVRPHWGKLSTMHPDRVRETYPRMHDFQRLMGVYDPTEKLTTDFLVGLGITKL